MTGGSSTGRGLQGRHVLAGMVLFFGVVFAVNGVFLYSALSTHTGVVAIEPYRKGLEYNDRIAAAERQQQLGWVDELTAARDGRLQLLMTDAGGRGVAGLAISGVIGRPSTAAQDRMVHFRETAPGRYEADAGVLEEGAWIASLEAASTDLPGQPSYRSRKRLWLKP